MTKILPRILISVKIRAIWLQAVNLMHACTCIWSIKMCLSLCGCGTRVCVCVCACVCLPGSGLGRCRFNFRPTVGRGLATLLPRASRQCTNLLSRLCEYDPDERYGHWACWKTTTWKYSNASKSIWEEERSDSNCNGSCHHLKMLGVRSDVCRFSALLWLNEKSGLGRWGPV